jgi:hypothetical protein
LLACATPRALSSAACAPSCPLLPWRLAPSRLLALNTAQDEEDKRTSATAAWRKKPARPAPVKAPVRMEISAGRGRGGRKDSGGG